MHTNVCAAKDAKKLSRNTHPLVSRQHVRRPVGATYGKPLGELSPCLIIARVITTHCSKCDAMVSGVCQIITE